VFEVLTELRIHNLAVIDELAIEFGPGLNVLTGETGAGKSIILGALGLVLGGRGTPDLVRTGEESARVGAAFEARIPEPTAELLTKYGLTVDDEDTVIVARQLASSGRSRVYINDQFATTTLLKALGEAWVDLHGQHEHQSLFRTEEHLTFLDDFAGVAADRSRLSEAHARIQVLRSELRALQQEQRETLREREYLEHEVEELGRADLRPDEDVELEAERRRLQNAETLRATAESLFGHLGPGVPGSVLENLRVALQEIRSLRQFDESLKETESRLDALFYEAEDIATRVRQYRDSVEFSPERKSQVEDRLVLLFELKRRYGGTLTDAIARLAESQARLSSLTTGSAEIERVRENLRSALREAGRMAFALSDARQTAASALEERVEAQLAELGMERTAFRVSVTQDESESGLLRRHERSYNLSATGLDAVEFLISPNVGEALKPLNRIASGGEISRVMLALKTVLSDVDRVPTLVFDEIDTGIGGSTAAIVGTKLSQLAETRQVICITHLPQIASRADRHFRVAKHVEGDGSSARTVTTVERLTDDERVSELARMLGGDSVTSRAHAHELLASRSLTS